MIALALLAGCHPPVTIYNQVETPPHAIGCVAATCGDSARLISVTYLGVSGLIISHDGAVMMTAPFFSNPPLAAVISHATNQPFTSNGQAIERFLPRSADQASAVLIGHGHYDHLMDIPYIATRRATFAALYGGPSVRHTLMGDSTLRANSGRVIAIDSIDAATPDRAGRWFYALDRRFRFMPIRASHAPTLNFWKLGYTFASGVVKADMARLPRTADGWKLGEPYAFLIDVLDQRGAAVFRIYFQDAPSEPPLGFLPRSVLDEHQVDLAIICAATSSNVREAPDALLTLLKPLAVILTHWESFFRSQSSPPALNPTTDLPALYRSLRRSLPPSAGWAMPNPQTTFRFRPDPRP